MGRSSLYTSVFKRGLDIMLASLMLLLSWPVLLLLAGLVRQRLGAPVLFRQERPGLHGEPFVLLKFRTMSDLRDESGRLLPDCDRLDELGRLLRRSSLDELPELWNVLKGEMSLVGPRPLLVEYLPYYTESEKHRHDVRPGLTGLAQISGRNYLEWGRRLELDVQYVERCGLWLDLRILLRTLWQVLLRRGVAEVPGTVSRDLVSSRMGRRSTESGGLDCLSAANGRRVRRSIVSSRPETEEGSSRGFPG